MKIIRKIGNSIGIIFNKEEVEVNKLNKGDIIIAKRSSSIDGISRGDDYEILNIDVNEINDHHSILELKDISNPKRIIFSYRKNFKLKKKINVSGKL
jgi:hypothetical protein